MVTYLILINAVGLAVMFLDKQFAIRQRRRIPEASLLTVAAVGGSVGCLMGMYLFRHKTRKPKFAVGIPALLAVQALTMWFVLSKTEVIA